MADKGWISKYAFEDKALAADATGRAAMEDGFFEATAAMRAKFADGFITVGKVTPLAVVTGVYGACMYGHAIYK